jgi:hypothetical protein
VVVVSVGVHDPADGKGAELAKIGADLVGLAVRRPDVDQEQAVVTANDADTHVQRLVAALEDPGRHLGPARHVPRLVRAWQGVGKRPVA